MSKTSIRRFSIVVLGLSLGLWASIIIPSIRTKKTSINAPVPSYEEQSRILTEIEQATMSADFEKDFEKNLETMNASPKPTPFFMADIPSTMAGDLIAPTVTIQSGPTEGTTVTTSNLCFDLWVSDNMTPWQQLGTRAQIDKNQWGAWSQMTSYCFQNVSDGVHTFTVQIRDLAGNVSPEMKRTFIVRQ